MADDNPASSDGTTSTPTIETGESADGRELGRQRLAELFAAGGAPDLDSIAAPIFWPTISSADIAAEWHDLRVWVERLVVRYPHLDHHVIPRCWWRHNSHVEALQALRDHERVSFAESAAGTAATDWQWRFALIEGRLLRAGRWSVLRRVTPGLSSRRSTTSQPRSEVRFRVNTSVRYLGWRRRLSKRSLHSLGAE